MSKNKSSLIKLIEERKEDLVQLCCDLVKIPSDNPPGDTSELAEFIEKYLSERGVQVAAYEPKPKVINLVANIGEGSPNLILNGHLDQFPGDVGEKWTDPPYSGLVKDDRIFGRGSGDMKGGLASLLFCFSLLTEIGSLPGRVTFTATSDEETGGRWGAYWLLNNVEKVKGDAVLNGEPSGLTVRVGEKGKLTIRIVSTGKAAHGSFAGYVGENAIMKMVRVLPLIDEFHGTPAVLNPEMEEVTKEAMRGYVQQYGHESSDMAEVLRLVTVNIGTIQGGTSNNIVPARCTVEVDVRVPLGISPDSILKVMKDKVREVEPSLMVEWGRDPLTITPSTYSPLESHIATIVAENSCKITGNPPLYSFTSGGTDSRFWRQQGVPAVSFGPRVFGMGGVDENITVDDLIATAKVHMGSILDFFQ